MNARALGPHATDIAQAYSFTDQVDKPDHHLGGKLRGVRDEGVAEREAAADAVYILERHLARELERSDETGRGRGGNRGLAAAAEAGPAVFSLYIPALGHDLFAPTAAIMDHFREVALLGRPTPVVRFGEPPFAQR